MPEIPYERLDAIEAALGGRDAINAAYQAGVPLAGAQRFAVAHLLESGGFNSVPLGVLPLVSGAALTIPAVPQTYGAGMTWGLLLRVPAGADVVLDTVELAVYNAGLTESLAASNPSDVTVPAGTSHWFSLAELSSVYGVVGADLSFVEGEPGGTSIGQILSAAGGVYSVQAVLSVA